jgi:thiamine-phosphate pyrophosphorylase
MGLPMTQLRCELYLRLRGDDLPTESRLEDITRIARPAAVLIACPENGIDHGKVTDFIKSANRRNLAVLIQDNAELAVSLAADGVHLGANGTDVAKTRAVLSEDSVIGASSPLSRHEAMVLAEAGADYVAFGGGPGDDGRDIEALVEMTNWWAELFELPCALCVTREDSDDDIRRLVEAGADFLMPEIDADAPDEALARLREFL